MPRTETYSVTYYRFEELSLKAQDKAIEGLYDLNVDHDWWEYVYEDAERIGARITGFDTGRGDSIDFELKFDPKAVAEAILKEHGPDCDTYRLAKQFIGDYRDDENQADADREFRYALGEEYLSMLRKEYEYQTSREAIVEAILANEYEFHEDGTLRGRGRV